MSDQIQTRPPRTADAPAISALVAAATSGWLGFPETTAETIADSWRSPGLDVGNDAIVAVRGGEEVVGYAFLQPRGRAAATFWFDLWTRPGPGERAAAGALLSGLQGRFRALARGAPLGATVSLRARVSDGQAAVCEALEQDGFAVVRRALQMVADLELPYPAPAWPEGIRVRTFTPSDARAVHSLTMDALGETWGFTSEPFETWVAETEAGNLDASLWWMVEAHGELVAEALFRPDELDPELVWLKVMAVRRGWRGRWLVATLFFHAVNELKERGFRRAGAGMDAENASGVPRLAERAGFQLAQTFLIYERRLRGPRPIRRLLRRARRIVVSGAGR